LELARARTRYAFLRAPVDGTLIGRHVEVGDVVQAGKVLMTLSPTGRTQLVLAIDEKNMHLLALGQKALASADAYPKQRFGASLVYINPGVNPQTGAVEVKLDVAQQLPHIGQDMTVSVDIEVARRPNALIVPADSVRDIDAAAPWVLRVEDGHAVRRSVGLGLQSGGMVEVLEGLREGDALVPTSLPVVAGARVRTLAPSR
jgi:HlyD family secretion protein